MTFKGNYFPSPNAEQWTCQIGFYLSLDNCMHLQMTQQKKKVEKRLCNISLGWSSWWKVKPLQRSLASNWLWANTFLIAPLLLARHYLTRKHIVSIQSHIYHPGCYCRIIKEFYAKFKLPFMYFCNLDVLVQSQQVCWVFTIVVNYIVLHNVLYNVFKSANIYKHV